MYRFCSWFLDQYDVGLFQIIIVPRNPPKKKKKHLHKFGCQSVNKKRANSGSIWKASLHRQRLSLSSPLLRHNLSAEKPRHMTFVQFPRLFVVSCKVETINKSAKLLLSSWELLTSCMSTGMRSGEKKLLPPNSTLVTTKSGISTHLCLSSHIKAPKFSQP